MCISPRQLEDGTQVRCRNCWQCRAARIDDWVGRCIAESKTVAGANAITLTYGRDKSTESVTYGDAEHERAAVLTYSDVQKYFKKLRKVRKRGPNGEKYGYPCRYFVTGEYGSQKGRAHWHVIVFWLERVPPHEVGKRFLEEHWDHGVSFWTAPSYEDFRYNCKYILKGMGEAERQGHLSMSKKPLLGAAYFVRMARDYAKQGLAPKDGYYTFPEALRKNGQRVRFELSGAAKALFIEAWAKAWGEFHGDKPMPHSDWSAQHLDPVRVDEWLPLTRKLLSARKQHSKPAGSPDGQHTPEGYWFPRDGWHRLAAAVHRDTGSKIGHDEWERIVSGKAARYDELANTWIYEANGLKWAWRKVEHVWTWQKVERRETARQAPRAQIVPRPQA